MRSISSRREIDRVLGLMGATRIADIGADQLFRASDAARSHGELQSK